MSAAWIELSKGQAPCSRSVLLDYISTFQLLSFYRSIKNGHVAVALVVLGFVFLKVATIASIGLFVLRPRIATQSQLLTLGDNFDGSQYNSSDLSFYLRDQSPVFTAYGVTAAQLERPFGTSPHSAYATFELREVDSTGDTNTTFAATVDAVFPDITCQPVEASVELLPLNLTVRIANPQHQIRLSAPNCDNNPGPIVALNPAKYLCPSRQLSGTIYQINCQNDNGTESDNWRLITMTDVRYQQSVNESEPVGDSISYSTGKLNVMGRTAVYPSGLAFARVTDSDNGQLNNFGQSNFSKMLNRATAAASTIFQISDDDAYADEVPETVLKIMASQANNSYAALFDNKMLIAAAETALTNIAVEAISRYLRPTSSTEAMVTMSVSRESVYITEVSAWLMFGAFVSVTLISLVLIIQAGSTSSVRANTLLDMSGIYQKSTSLHRLFVDTRRHKEDQISKHLATYWFCAPFDHADHSFSIAAVPSKDDLNDAEQLEDHEGEIWWKQITLSYWFLGLTFVYGAALIITLEILQRLSNSRGGIGAIATSGDLLKTSITHYLPALAMIILAAMFNCLDFNVLLLYPYHQLRKGVSHVSLGLRPPIQQLPLVSFSKALWRFDCPIVGSSAAAFIGALLTIVVSGLYSIERFSTPMGIKVDAIDVVTGAWTTSVYDDGGAAILTSLTENSNLSYPLGTYEEFAIPLFRFPDLGKVQPSPAEVTVSVTSMAYRSNLMCEMAASGAYNITIQDTNSEHIATIGSTYSLPPNCLRGGSGGNSPELSFKHEFRFPINDTVSYVAKLLDLHVGPYRDGGFAASEGEIFPGNNPDNPAGCPSIAMIYGLLNEDDLTRSIPEGQNIAVQVCYQELDRMEVNVTLETTDMHISTSKPPVITKADSEKLSVAGTNETAFQFRIQAHLDNALSFFNNPENPFASVAGVKIVDRFFQGLFFGRNSIPLKTMELVNQSDHELMQASILGLYRRYMAQVITAKMRTDITQLTDTQLQEHSGELSFEGVITTGISENRIVQHNIPKLVLQAMIAFMLAGGILAISTMQLIDILPASANPCTIWGQLSLWAGSRWCEEPELQGGEVGFLAPVSKSDSASVSVSELPEIGSPVYRPIFKLAWWTRRTSNGHLDRRYGFDVVPQR
ncbi:hypothetical protein LTR70_003697 [Exophiala xenobiotica]|uniref:Uncharacterized protein n=1 Tax=Lithohypha guttulata TaxID=1690604 RepID=A0ABR0KI65_9EURO|nr:hypothetical protein LTR24_002342 [Lithohypha guttulata]KAK5322749.1 hypothetical protein LTR70_003697 [Exophiala xenobiotica]